MFWGLTLEPGKKYSQLVDYSFRLSMAALEPLPNVAKDKRHVSIMLDHQKTEYMLCTLEHGKLYQQRLELNFVDGEEVCFYIIGQGMVHLTGYHIDNICGDSILCDDDDNDLSTDEECSDESSDDENIGFDTKNGNLSEDSEDDDWTPAKVGEKRNRSSVGNSVVKKMKPNASVKTEISDMTYMTPRRKSSSSNNVDSDQDDEEDGSDSGSSDGEDDSLKKINTAKLGKLNINDSVQIKKNKKKFQIDSSDEKHIDYLKVPVFGRHKDEKCTDSKQLSNKKKKRQLEVTKNVDSVEKQDKSSSSVKQDQNRTVIKESQSAKKKKKKKSISNDSPKDDASVVVLRDDHHGSVNNKQKSATPSSSAVGFTREDIRLGKGPVAKSGRIVHVYYAGKLANNKKFDSVTSGKPYRFRLGSGEVIKGWDLGVEGMRVGGKRMLTIPPSLAYGSKGNEDIPGNSTLNFEVELKAVN